MNDLKIKFYQEAESCSWANRFKTDMTFGELKKSINEDKFEKSKIKAYSPEFDQEIYADAYIIDGMKVKRIILEDGSKVELRPNIYGQIRNKDYLLEEARNDDKFYMDNFIEPLVKLKEQGASVSEVQKLCKSYSKIDKPK